MSFKQSFEHAWSTRFPNGVEGVRTSAPVLNCWDALGRLRSEEALSGELERCRSRIVKLRNTLIEQEFVESFCLTKLQQLTQNGLTMNNEGVHKTSNGAGPPTPFKKLTPKRSFNDGVERIKTEEELGGSHQLSKSQSVDGLKSNSSIDSVTSGSSSDVGPANIPRIEFLYTTPVDNKAVEVESLYSEPINAVTTTEPPTALVSPQNTESELYTNASDMQNNFLESDEQQVLCRKSSSCSTTEPPSLAESPNWCHAKRAAYEEVIDVKQDSNGDGGSSDGEEESISNLIAIRQSVSRLSHWCVDGGAARRKLELQAQRLSTRFSFVETGNGCAGSGSWGNKLGTLEESLLSPTTPSAPMDLLGGSVGMDVETGWSIAPSILTGIEHSGVSQSEGMPSANSPVSPPSGPLDMRQWIVTTQYNSERSYVITLEALLEVKESLWTMVGSVPTELNAIYNCIQKLFAAHKEFLNELGARVQNWSAEQAIGDIVKIMAVHEYAIAPDYLRNYQRAAAAISRCRQENINFDTIVKAQQTSADQSSIEEMLHKPVVRFERNTLVLHDLIKYTPTGHVDYDQLQKTLKLARRFLDNLETPEVDKDNPEFQRYLVKHGLIVEKIAKERKLRHVFLFNDVIVCAKQKITKSAKDQYEVKWFIPLTDLSLEDKLLTDEDMRVAEDHKQEIDVMQRKVSELQAEYKMELKKSKGTADKPRLLRKNKTLEKTHKKLIEQEVALVIAMPHLQFRVHNRKQHKEFLLMMSSDYERSDWREAITGLLQKAFIVAQYCSPVTPSDVQNLLGRQKMMPKGSSLDRDSINMEEDRLYGSLHVLVNKLTGLKQPQRTFCRIEVDCFGHFLMKAKTNVLNSNKQPTWNERFEVDLDGAQTLRVLCYSHDKSVDTLLGRAAIELSGILLRDEFQEHNIPLGHDLSLSVSLKYLSHSQTLQRCSTNLSAVLFGAPLASVCKREGRSIPLLVTSCIQEIENRGMSEEGLYRISGLAMDIDELKDEFEKNPASAASHKVKNADINVLTSIVKMFFRSLPDPLFTEALYTSFAEGIGLADPDAKDSCLLALVRRLPEQNFCTVVFLLQHLIKVSQLESRNKMGLRNLATVFGPTLLRPANRNSQPKTMEQLFFVAAHEVTVQTTVLYQLLVMKAAGVEFDVIPTAITAF